MLCENVSKIFLLLLNVTHSLIITDSLIIWATLFSHIKSTFVSSVGQFVVDFENKIAEFCGVKRAVACVNGTNALHLSLKLAGVKDGDKVITQPLTFIATANAIKYCNAEPVFIDVDS